MTLFHALIWLRRRAMVATDNPLWWRFDSESADPMSGFEFMGLSRLLLQWAICGPSR